MKTFRFIQFVRLSMVSFMLLSIGLQTSPTYARPATDDPPQEALDCIGDLQGTISGPPEPVDLWQRATLRWNVTVPRICTGIGVKLYVDKQEVSATGSLSVLPIGSTAYRLHAALPAALGGGRRTLTTTGIKVKLPPIVTISANHWVPLLVQALRFEENTDKDGYPIDPAARRYIYIENHVELNLSGRESIPIEDGVTLKGGRTAREAGPRLFTTIRPNVLFKIKGDNVRITGVRIEGPDHSRVVPEDEEPNKGIGILDEAYVNIEINHNEIYGWSQAAVRVDDCDGPDGCPPDNRVLSSGRMLPSENPTAVRIHDNYIHHNQRAGREGYGVSVNHGAYVLIERNVFDWNRHAIKGGDEVVDDDPLSGAGYAAYRNLVLENGGYHDSYNHCDLLDNIPDYLKYVRVALSVVLTQWLDVWAAAELSCLIPGKIVAYEYYTHQFDMHGTGTDFPGHLNSGIGGHSMYIRQNSFLYTRGDAIKLRGTPKDGMFVESNVFAHDTLRTGDVDALSATGCTLGLTSACADVRDNIDFFNATAVEQTKTGLVPSNNLLGVNGMDELGTCDFDGDGLNDSFLATGQTWWYSSEGKKPWVYLNTSLKRRSQVTLGPFNADNICDVWVDGIVYPGGKPQKLPVNHIPPGGGVASTALSN